MINVYRAASRVVRRALFVALGLACAAPQVLADASPLFGTWRGHIGNKEVMVCLSDFNGSYYDLRHLRGIPLSPDDNHEGKTSWIETEAKAWEPKTTGRWSLQPRDHTRLIGQWTSPDGLRKLSIALTRLAPADASGAGCGSEFLAPLLRAIQLTPHAAQFQGRPYQALSSATGTSLVLPGTSAAIRRVNNFARAWLDEQAAAAYDCALHGGEAWEPTLRPKLWSRHWLVLDDSLPDTYCGGPHGNWSMATHSFNLATGEHTDTWAWLKQGEKSVAQAEGDQQPYGLRALLEQLNPRDDCDAYFWVRPPYATTKGLVFGTSYPHAARACDDDIAVSYKALAPYLSLAGKAVASQMSRP